MQFMMDSRWWDRLGAVGQLLSLFLSMFSLDCGCSGICEGRV